MMARTRKQRIYLNSANERALGPLPLIGPDIAKEIIRRRPFKSWEDFTQAFGFDQDIICIFREAGATMRLPTIKSHLNAARSKRGTVRARPRGRGRTLR